MVNKEFGMVNQLAVIVPNGDYEKEAQTLKALEKLDVVKSVQGLGNIEAMDGYMLTDKLNPRQFAELIDLDVEVADMLYSAYALDQSDYGALVSGVNDYEVPLSICSCSFMIRKKAATSRWMMIWRRLYRTHIPRS